MSPRSVNYRGLDTADVRGPRCLQRVASAASAAPVALSFSLRLTESERASPSSVARSAVTALSLRSGLCRSWIASGPGSIRHLPAGFGRGRLMGVVMVRSPMAATRAASSKFTASSTKRSSGRSQMGCNSTISAACVAAAGRTIWSRSPRQRTSVAATASLASTLVRPTAPRVIRSMRRTRLFGSAAGATVEAVLRQHGGSTGPSASDRAAWAEIQQEARASRFLLNLGIPGVRPQMTGLMRG